MSTIPANLKLPRPVSRKVTLLRWLVRSYVLAEGVASIALLLGVCFWTALAIDWMFEPAPAVRALMWIAVVLGAAWVADRYLVSRLAKSLSNSNLALLLERCFPQFSQSLITTVETADCRHAEEGVSRTLLSHTSAEAQRSLAGVSLFRVFRYRPLAWKLSAAVLLVTSTVAWASFENEAFGFWLNRMKLSTTPWPRLVELSVEDFAAEEGLLTAYVARDDDFELHVAASIRDGHAAPAEVELRYRLGDGRRGRDTMTRIGEAIPGRDDAQAFRYTFKKLTSDLTFDVVGGDDRIENLRLKIVQRPQVARVLFDCEFPNYLQREPRTIPVSGRVELAEGTACLCRFESTKPLESVRIHDPTLQEEIPVTIDSAAPTEFACPLALGRRDRVLLVTMHDRDGVENREPYQIVVSVIEDLPPDVSVQVRGISTAVTPQAVIPFGGSIIDEYGVEQAWFQYQVDDGETLTRPSVADRAREGEGKIVDRFDLALIDPATQRPQVELEPGQKLRLALAARDAYDLTPEPHVGTSAAVVLDVVNESELRAMLERRELSLRQHFEAIYDKMVGTQELVERMKLAGEETADAESLRLDRLKVGGAKQNVIQMSYETSGLAEGFEGIVTELENNRIQTEELRERLVDGIAEPLHAISGEMMPLLEERLAQLESEFDDPEGVRAAYRQVVEQGDVVLAEMKRVLDRMLELESYNELVEILRGIVSDHEALRQQTEQQRREKLRSLLQEE